MERIIKQQLVDQVIGHLKNAVASGEYAIGARLPAEPRLMEELGVGRSTLREAVRALAHNGIVEVRQGDGTYVRSLPAAGETLSGRLRRAKVGEVQEVRRALELEIVRLAAERRKGEDLRRMRAHLEVRREALAGNDLPAALEADIAFHCAVAGAAGNRVLADLYRTFALTLRDALSALWDVSVSSPADTDDLHAGLMEAIAARDVRRAAAAAVSLLDIHDVSIAAAEAGAHSLKREGSKRQ